MLDWARSYSIRPLTRISLSLTKQRHYAEHSGYFGTTSFLADAVDELEASADPKEITFYDSNTGKPLFHVPRGRTWEEFVHESKNHGWPSFRDKVRFLRVGVFFCATQLTLPLHSTARKPIGRMFAVCATARPSRWMARTWDTTCLMARAIDTASTS